MYLNVELGCSCPLFLTVGCCLSWSCRLLTVAMLTVGVWLSFVVVGCWFSCVGGRVSDVDCQCRLPQKILKILITGAQHWAFIKIICAGICKQYVGVRNRVGIGLSYRPARLHRLAELNPWNRFLDSLKSLEIRALHEEAELQLYIGEKMREWGCQNNLLNYNMHCIYCTVHS
jgi:hypothetical protein